MYSIRIWLINVPRVLHFSAILYLWDLAVAVLVHVHNHVS